MQGDFEDGGGYEQEIPISTEGLSKCVLDGEEECIYLGENSPWKEGEVQQPYDSPPLSDDVTIPRSSKGYVRRSRDEIIEALRDKVQVPNAGAFDRKDLKWEVVQNNGGGQKIDTFEAIIPWNKLRDFVEGESTNRDFPCTFLEASLKCVQKVGEAEKPQANSAVQKIRFQCEFGPEDKTHKMKDDVEKIFAGHLQKKLSTNQKIAAKRVAKQVAKATKDSVNASKVAQNMTFFEEAFEVEAPPIVPPSPPKPSIRARRASKVQAGLSKKRGCLCKFDAKQLYLDTTLCAIQFHCFDHINKQSEPCHGRSFAGFRHSVGARLSESTNIWIRNCLGQGLTPSQIMAKHKQEVLDAAMKGEKCSRDTFIMPDDVYNIAKKRASELWQMHVKDEQSVRIWVEGNPDMVFYYQEFGILQMNEIPKTEEEASFCLGIQTPWQQTMMLQHGHNRALSMDSTFGTNEPRYPLYTILAFDEWQNGIPVAFIIVGKAKEKDITPWLTELDARAKTVKLDWKPKAFVVDNAKAEINAIKNVWPDISILLCLWHVRKAWNENAVRNIQDPLLRAQVLNAVACIMYSSDLNRGEAAVKAAEVKIKELSQLYPNAKGFIEYFEANWMGKTSMWVTGNRNFPHSGQDTNAAVESYHRNLKSILAITRNQLLGRRMDWLIYNLVNDVLNHYWYGVQCKIYGFTKNRKMEGIVASVVLRAREIPNDYISIFTSGKDIVLVMSMTSYPHVWTVTAPNSDWAQCDCPQGVRGYICKHVIKAIKMIHPCVEDAMIMKQTGTLCGTTEGGYDTLQIDAFQKGKLVQQSDDCDVLGDNCQVGKTSVNHASRQPHILTTHEKLIQEARKILSEIESMVMEDSDIAMSAVAHLAVVQGKLIDRQALASTGLLHPASQCSFPLGECDNRTRRQKSFLEGSSNRGDKKRARIEQ